MKVGDLVHDSSYGMNGVVIDRVPDSWAHRLFQVWQVLYEDGRLDIAYENEVEVINESR